MAKGHILIFSIALFISLLTSPSKPTKATIDDRAAQKVANRSGQLLKQISTISDRRTKQAAQKSAQEIKRLVTMAARGQSRAIVAAKPWRITDPATHICQFQISEALIQGHAAALVYYRTKQYQKAADRLALMFDLTSDLVGLIEPGQEVEMPDRWISAWNRIGLDFPYYILELNDYGYFLQKAGNHVDAVKVLSAVVVENPQRTAAHINLADSLWETSQQELAVGHYKTYRSLMIENGYESLIPSRVAVRIAPVNTAGNATNQEQLN
ncbi:hypothetical protein Pse7367_2908 [Thalassoporum mexicanum PCC 7367]|uniref:hypothetical protein n=1 Tax=Thalassoporum mexicanum TaxID=3457544 RepID=UPI00029FCE75|nr:hypothetical protein [Pseudanabaena sp. PCC 7367]AFY71161.1 hypothetical protein Pse7367_2908 [Pseudanabaena sp. PCC 7367]